MNTSWIKYIVYGAIAIAIVAVVMYFKNQIVALFSPSTTTASTLAATATATDTGTIVAPVAGASTSVSITATDSMDPYPRDWQVFQQDPSGLPIQTQGNYSVYGNLTPIAKAVQSQGATWVVASLAPGDYYFIVGQTGGSKYGTYSGTIVQAAQSVPFSGVTCTQAVHFVIAPPAAA